jgi:3-hydroxyacyl-[acyl-carrier-protein] dehydratase
VRYLLIDRVLAWTPYERVSAVKNVTMESDVLEHHFPGFPLLPGALTLEAMAQAAGYLIMRSLLDDKAEHRAVVLSTVERLHLHQPVHPGDQLRLEVTVEEWTPTAVRVVGAASVDGATTARGRLILAHRRFDDTQHADAIQAALRWMRSFERPRGGA